MCTRPLTSVTSFRSASLLVYYSALVLCLQVLRRKERECEHEMERLAREKIAAQQRLAALKREVSVRVTARPRTVDPISDDKIREEQVNGQVLGISVSILAITSQRKTL
ncbi:Max binding protein mnt [Operophtera brumata]|uniref:Max binding protein mnt n=1 Tax=Operophtera brumata TaxID=104452 RepID=A0A0L7LC86_OPEBR|nr:Max binding protein mnt [Operophtera brumata]